MDEMNENENKFIAEDVSSVIQECLEQILGGSTYQASKTDALTSFQNYLYGDLNFQIFKWYTVRKSPNVVFKSSNRCSRSVSSLSVYQSSPTQIGGRKFKKTQKSNFNPPLYILKTVMDEPGC